MQFPHSMGLPTLQQSLNCSPLIVTSDTPVMEAISRMAQLEDDHSTPAVTSPGGTKVPDPDRLGCALVVEEARLIGILTEKDVVRLMAERKDLSNLSISHAMTQPAVTLTPSEAQDIAAVLALMHQHRVQHLPVVNEQGQVLGLLTRDRLYQLMEPVPPPPEQTTPLSQINQQLQQEIEERQHVEAALQMREHQWQALYQSAQDAILIADDNGRYVDANPAACELFGLSRDELLQSSVADFSDPDIDTAQIWQQFIEQGQMAGEFRLYRPDGTIRETDFAAVANFVPHRHLSILRDISERKRLEAERRQAAEALQQQLAREQLVAEIAQYIRQSLNLNEVLYRTVSRVRQLLQTDRVIIFRVNPIGPGTVVMESVSPDWTPILSTTVSDPCFHESYIDLYRQGRVTAIADLHAIEIAPCYLELLTHFQVRANLVVPILQGETLWGLLIAHHCSAPRQWLAEEIELLQRLATQVGIATQQSELYQQTCRELLERRRMQDALQESEERFRSLSAAAPIGIFQTDADGFCLYTNACWQRISGRAAEDCLGNGWTQVIHPDDREAVLAAWKAYLDHGQEFAQEFRLLTRQGNVRWVLARAAPLRSPQGVVIGHVVTAEDNTERKQAEHKIREQAALIDIATDAIFVQDLETRIVFWGRGAERLYGWTAEEVQGKRANDLFYETVSSHREESMQAMLHQGFWQGELEQVTKTTQRVIVASRWTLVRDEMRRPQSVLVVNSDITEKKQLEAQFYRAQRLESLGTLASGIAHDLNNVFTPILAIAQLLSLKLPNTDEQTQELL